MPRTSAPERRLAESSDAYLKNCASVGLSPRTVHNYQKTIEDFMNFFIESKENYTDPDYATIRLWRDALTERGCSPTAVRQYLTRLHAFFEFACDPSCGGWYKTNPVSKRLFPNTRREEKRPYDTILTDAQVMRLWRNDRPGYARTATYPRNYAIVILLLTTELRNAELLHLTLADLHWQEGEIFVERGKGNKFRRVEFPEIAQSAVRIYLASGIRPRDLPDTAPLFGTTSKKGVFGTNERDGTWTFGSAEWLSALVMRHVKAVTGVDNVRTHDLRHVGARIDLNSGMRQEALQAKLGHASPGTTQIYSGKLMGKSETHSAALVLEARDRQAAINEELLQNA